MKYLASFPVLIACLVVSLVRAQPLDSNGVPVMSRTRAIANMSAPASEQKPPSNCQAQQLSGDSVRAASARLFMAAHASLSQAETVKALLVALSINSSCTGSVHNPQLFNGSRTAG